MEKDLNLKVKTDHRCEYCDMKFLSKKKLVEHLVNHKNLQQQQPETAVMLGQHQPEVAVMLGQQQQDVQQQQHPNTGYSLSEALILASINPNYDNGVFIELRVQYVLCSSNCFCFDIQNNSISTNVLNL